MQRRRFLGTGVAASVAALAGCSGLFETQPAIRRNTQLVEDRPDAVYVPTHADGMEMIGTASDGRYKVGLSYTYPHVFWLMTGGDRDRVEVGSDTSVHLMATVWDSETGLVVPSGGLRFEITREGEPVVSKSAWSMLSQNMSFHFGDNIALDGDGTYEVAVSISPPSARTTGAFDGAFESSAEATFDFEYSRSTLGEIPYQPRDDAGERGALEPMQMDMLPVAQLPPTEELSGRVFGEATSGDAAFAATALSEPPAGLEGDGAYLAVSPRTPYNRFPLPLMSVSARLDRGGEAVFDGECAPTFDSDLGYHYGAALEDGAVESGDELTVSVGAPPQVSRHEGYETAFLEFDDVTLTLSE
jgi:uncharacterized protein involved in high-affinity Fe2+ transport